jgi:hypothetical protein
MGSVGWRGRSMGQGDCMHIPKLERLLLLMLFAVQQPIPAGRHGSCYHNQTLLVKHGQRLVKVEAGLTLPSCSVSRYFSADSRQKVPWICVPCTKQTTNNERR